MSSFLPLYILAGLLILTLMTSGCLGSRKALAPMERKALGTEIDGIVSMAYPDAEGPGCAVLVRMDGEDLFARGYGLANLESHEPITPATDFRLASITKQFTAACILRLIEGGKLSLDDSLTNVFPEFPPYGAAITVRHLLGHTSGLVDYEDLMPEGETEQVHDGDVLRMMEGQSAGAFAPGERYAYSNSGYAVLAMIVEARSGRRFADFLKDEFFAPLGMTNTVAFEKGRAEVPHRAFGYKRNDDGTCRFADQSSTSAVLGDGGVYTSINDYAKWADAWFGGRVLSPQSREFAWTPGRLNDGSATECQ